MSTPPRGSWDETSVPEQWLVELLRELPARSAPRTLQSRVFAELARRAALPWWRRSFRHWSAMTRTAFIAVCAALSALTVLGGSRLLLHVPVLAATGALPLTWAAHLQALSRAGADLAGSLGRTLPLTWLYGALALAAALYAVLFALGATAYRMLRLQGDRS